MSRIFLITGRIGSGKSTVTKMIEQRGHRVIKLDNFAKDLAKTSEAKFKYLEIFGKEALNDDASLNIDYLKKFSLNLRMKKRGNSIMNLYSINF